MNQRRKKRGFPLNRRKIPKNPTQRPSNSLRKQQSSCFSMHSHPFIFSMMYKCSYTVKKEHPNKPVEAPIKPSEDSEPPTPQQKQQQSQPNVRGPISATALVTRHDHSRKSEAAPTTPSKASVIKRGKVKRRVTIGSNQTSVDDAGGIGGGGGGDEAEWPPFADEDYIVFCFEDGGFQVKMEENSRSQDWSEHGYSDGSPRPHNLKVEEERFYFSPRLQSDGIRSSTRFKKEVEYEEMDRVVEARGRVDVDMECKEMDGIKNRGQLNDDDQEDDINDEEDFEFRDTSIECVNGSAESIGSNQSDWEQTLQLAEEDQEGIRLSSSSPWTQDGQVSNQEGSPESLADMTTSLVSKKMVDDEESVYLSSESQQEGSRDDDELSNNDEQSGRGSAAASDTGRSETGEEDQLEDHEEPARISTASSNSSEESLRSSSSSFEFPALQWQWIGSPDIWPKPELVRFRKQKSCTVCLHLCRF